MRKISQKKLITIVTLAFLLFGFFSSSIYALAHSEGMDLSCSDAVYDCSILPKQMEHSAQHAMMPCCFEQGSHFSGTVSNCNSGKIIFTVAHLFSDEASAELSNVSDVITSSSSPPNAERLASIMKKE
ncbi:MAG: hypothetical protein WC238_01040 [Parcubacteria group bacterium]|jgi:hypothetical protein